MSHGTLNDFDKTRFLRSLGLAAPPKPHVNATIPRYMLRLYDRISRTQHLPPGVTVRNINLQGKKSFSGLKETSMIGPMHLLKNI